LALLSEFSIRLRMSLRRERTDASAADRPIAFRANACMKGRTTEIQTIAVATRKLCLLGEIAVTSGRLRIFCKTHIGKLQRRRAELISTSDSFLFLLVRSRAQID